MQKVGHKFDGNILIVNYNNSVIIYIQGIPSNRKQCWPLFRIRRNNIPGIPCFFIKNNHLLIFRRFPVVGTVKISTKMIFWKIKDV